MLTAAGYCLIVASALTVIAALGLEWALVRSDYSLRFVAEHTTRNLPVDFRIAALWTGPAGAVLFTALVAGACAAATVRTGGQLPFGEQRPFALIILAAGVLVLLSLSALAMPPFERLPFLPLEGRGMSPQFQSVVGAVRPALSLAAAAFLLVPLALMADALWRRRADQRTWRPIAQWLFGAWLLQTVAFALGMWLALRESVDASWQGALSAVVPWILTTALVSVIARRYVGIRRRITWICVSGGVLLLVDLAASARARTYDVSLGAGQSRTLRDAFNAEWTLAQQGISFFRVENRDVIAATIEAVSATGRRVLLVPERRQFVDSSSEPIFAPQATQAFDLGVFQDVEAKLVAASAGDVAELRITFRPLASLIWSGCALLIVGSALAWIRSLSTFA